MSSDSESACERLRSLERSLGHHFRRPERLRSALTHTSARESGGHDYQRLEFLGDRVLGLIVADLLLQRFPEEPEGSIAKRFAALVSRESLAAVARAIELERLIILSRAEEESGGRDNPAIQADVCEALIGALYRDGGLEAAQDFVRRQWDPLVSADVLPPREPKTALQEWAQGRGLPLPRYRELHREGPAHDPQFLVEVEVEEHGKAEGEGRSKRQAEQDAARRLLTILEGQGQA
jgi:ribonuclease-3